MGLHVFDTQPSFDQGTTDVALLLVPTVLL